MLGSWTNRMNHRDTEKIHRLHQIHCSCMLQLIDFDERCVASIGCDSTYDKLEMRISSLRSFSGAQSNRGLI